MRRAYKFLSKGRVGPFSGFAWRLGEVVSAEARGCFSGIHAATIADLPYWIDEELFVVELSGPIERGIHKVWAPSGRLVEQVGAWTPAVASRYARATIERVRALVPSAPEPRKLDDAEDWFSQGEFAVAAYCAAQLAGTHEGYALERAAQAEWLRAELALVE